MHSAKMYRNSAYVVLLVIVCVNVARGAIDATQPNSIEDDQKNFTNERTGRSLHKECSGNLNAKCLKIHVLSFIEDLNSREELPLIGGLSIVKEKGNIDKNPKELAAELSRKFPGKPDEKLNKFLLYRLQDFLESHSLKYKLLDPETSKEAFDAVAVGRGKTGLGGGKGGGMGGLLAVAMMMKGTMGAAALAALALLAGKAMMTALMSLMLSAIVGLKGGGEKGHTTYEIITKPEVSHHHSHSQEEQHEYDHGHHGGHGYHRRAYDYDNSYNPYSSPS